MRRLDIAILSALALIPLAGATARAQDAPKAVYKMTDLTVARVNATDFKVHAKGTTRTAGWTNPQLEPRVAIPESEKGVARYTFVATPPSGVSAQHISPIELDTTITLTPG